MSRSDPSDESEFGGPALFGRVEMALTGFPTGPAGGRRVDKAEACRAA